jgi:hypothetical protein
VSPRPESKKARLRHWLDTASGLVDEARFAELKARLDPITDSYLRHLLRESGVPLSALVEGVSVSSFESLERTLLALAGAYETRPREARSVVIEAKVRLRWSASRVAADDRRAEKQEMLLWVLTWLENPGAFPVWLRLRKRCALSLCPAGRVVP